MVLGHYLWQKYNSWQRKLLVRNFKWTYISVQDVNEKKRSLGALFLCNEGGGFSSEGVTAKFNMPEPP